MSRSPASTLDALPLFGPASALGAAPPLSCGDTVTPRHTARPGARRRPDALRLCVLGSGSGGNATVLAYRGRAMLIDAGFGPRTTAARLAQAGLGLAQIEAVCLTHLDQDHFRRSWPATLLRLGIRLHLHHWHMADLARVPGAQALFDAGLVQPFDQAAFEPIEGVRARPIRLQHDRQGTIGYRLGCDRGRVGYATDLGHAPPSLIEHFAGVDLLAIEANYDERMTRDSPRPSFVNRRNMSSSGHLSNEQAFDAARHIASISPWGNPSQVVLLHRSSQCNHPTKLRRVFERDPSLARRITLTEQRRRSRWFTVRPLPMLRRRQLVLGF